MAMRAFISVALFLMVLLGADRAVATSDGGHTFRLLALAGRAKHIAIIAQESIQMACEEDCFVFTIDLRSAKWQPRHRLPIKSTDPLKAYLTARAGHGLAPLVEADKLEPLQFPIVEGTVQSLSVPRRDGSTFTVSSEVVTELASMATYDRNSNRYCVRNAKGPLTADCSTCGSVARTVAGERVPTIACEAKAGTWIDSPGGACDCHSKAQVIRLTLSVEGDVAANEALVEPFRLSQNWMNGSRQHETVGVDLRDGMLTAYELDGGLLVVGGLAHASMANGTYFPLMAWTPAKRAPTVEPPDAPGDAGDAKPVIVVAPTPQPRQGGCASCSVGATRAPSACWWLCAACAACRRRRR